MSISLVNVSLELYQTGSVFSPKVKILDDITMTVNKGENIGIIGHNGAGKSSLLRLLAGIYKPSMGVINNKFQHVSLATLELGFDYNLKGYDNIVISGMLIGFKYSEVIKVREEIIGFSELGKAIQLPMKTYSSGMSARLAFAIAFTLEADLMLVDEVLGVGDQEFKSKCENKFREMLESDKTLIIVSHDHDMISRCCDKIFRLGQGKLINVN